MVRWASNRGAVRPRSTGVVSHSEEAVGQWADKSIMTGAENLWTSSSRSTFGLTVFKVMSEYNKIRGSSTHS